MKKKIVITGSLVLMLVFGIFFYTNSSSLIADDKDGKKDCSSQCTQKAGSTENNSGCKENKMSGANANEAIDENATYEFVTDKITCDGCKPEISEKLMGITGVIEISYGETCKVSKMTNVKVFYSPKDTTPEIISASVKENGLQGKCGDDSKCDSKNKSDKKS